jgi:ferric-dicitrate binding protein FerR (iron transport regulator)
LQKLEKLEPPAADADAVRAWLAADRKVEDAVRDLVAAAQKRDFPSVSAAASRAQLAGSESRSAATSLGMQVCGAFAAAPSGR